MKKPTPSLSTEPVEQPVTYSHDKLIDTLLYLHDIMARASVPFVLDGQTLVDVLDDIKLTTPITIAIRPTDLTEYGRKTLQMFFDLHSFAVSKDSPYKYVIKTAYKEVPITMRVYKDTKFIERPDSRFYEYEQFQIPNPVSIFLQNELVV